MRLFLLVLLVLSFSRCKSEPSDSLKGRYRVTAREHYQTKGIIQFQGRPEISDQNGYPRDSLTFYLPPNTCLDTTRWFRFYIPNTKRWHSMNALEVSRQELSIQYDIPAHDIKDSIVVRVDSFKLRWYSYELFKMKEPILYNYYLNKSIYRLKYYPEQSGTPYSITLSLENDTAFVETKRMKYPIDDPFAMWYDGSTRKPLSREMKANSLAINTRKRIERRLFEHVASMVDSAELGSYPYWLGCERDNGHYMLIEIHGQNGYYYLNTCSGTNNTAIHKIINEILKASDLVL